jgi:nucleotide-binding universal stress UspA family protein
MAVRSILCPFDFSDPSRAALACAGAVADHFAARLIVLAVDDPLLAEAASNAGVVPSLAEETAQELQRVSRAVLGQPIPGPKQLELRVRTGKPDVEILREAREHGCDLIVMGSRGHTGVRKMFFGSTTERVLRETFLPVLVTPPDRLAVHSPKDAARHVGRVIAPADLTPASPHQLAVAAMIARTLSIPLLIPHVLEPVAVPVRIRFAMSGADAARRARAEDQLLEIVGPVAGDVKTETLVVVGDPAEEIIKLTAARQANLIVMGLHSSPRLGPRMGSVTYRVLALTRTLVLAIPPVTDAPS